jgi:hypothetical protein
MTNFNRNPRGLSGLAFRPHDRFVLGASGNCCGVKTRRTGEPCRQPPVRGSKRCRFHGGYSGRGRAKLPKTLRQGHNKAMRVLRKGAREKLEEGVELHPDLRQAFRAYARDVYPPNKEVFLLDLDQRLRGEMSADSWRAALELARRRT